MIHWPYTNDHTLSLYFVTTIFVFLPVLSCPSTPTGLMDRRLGLLLHELCGAETRLHVWLILKHGGVNSPEGHFYGVHFTKIHHPLRALSITVSHPAYWLRAQWNQCTTGLFLFKMKSCYCSSHPVPCNYSEFLKYYWLKNVSVNLC